MAVSVRRVTWAADPEFFVVVEALGGDTQARMAANALRRAGITTLEQLLAADLWDIKDVRGIGDRGVDRVQRFRKEKRKKVRPPSRYACPRCGTWICADCGWKRPDASLAYDQHSCARCPSREGTITATMHTERMWRLHNGDDSELPQAYAHGERPGDKPESRTSDSGPEFYRGVRVPKTGPYSLLDIPSFKLGVDAALNREKEA